MVTETVQSLRLYLCFQSCKGGRGYCIDPDSLLVRVSLIKKGIYSEWRRCKRAENVQGCDGYKLFEAEEFRICGQITTTIKTDVEADSVENR